MQTADGQTEQQTFTYHPNGLMNTATFNNQTQTLTNLWDADEHRVQFSVGEDDYTAVFDVTAGIPAVIKEVNPQGAVYYVREPGGELICRVVTVGETTHKWFYHFDELGSTRLITDDSTPAAVTDSYSYDAYGAVISHDRNTGTIEQSYQYVGQLGYYMHYQAPEFGWLQLGVRFYQPETARFTSADPSRQEFNTYAYASGSPSSLVDPSGLQCGPYNCGYGNYDYGQGIWRACNAIYWGLEGFKYEEVLGYGNPSYCHEGEWGVGACRTLWTCAGTALCAGSIWQQGAPCLRYIRTPPSTCWVTTWAPRGVEPTLCKERWVMPGGRNWCSYLRSYTWAKGYPYENSRSFPVPGGCVQWPRSWPDKIIDGACLGHRQYFP